MELRYIQPYRQTLGPRNTKLICIALSGLCMKKLVLHHFRAARNNI